MQLEAHAPQVRVLDQRGQDLVLLARNLDAFHVSLFAVAGFLGYPLRPT